jgi:hypothetical protein
MPARVLANHAAAPEQPTPITDCMQRQLHNATGSQQPLTCRLCSDGRWRILCGALARNRQFCMVRL